MKIPALLTILILPLSLLAARPSNAHAASPTFPIRAAFYYPWFPETWGPVSNRYTHYTPTLGYYNSIDTAIIDMSTAILSGQKQPSEAIKAASEQVTPYLKK